MTSFLIGKKSIRCKWILKIKYNTNNFVEHYKVSLIAKGCVQKEAIEYNDIFFLITKITSIYTLLGLVALEYLEV